MTAVVVPSKPELINLVNLVDVRVKSFCGTVAREEEAIPEEFRRGGLVIIDPKYPRVFASLRQKAMRLCMGVGSRFKDSVAVSNEELPSLMIEIGKLAQEFDCAKREFVANYESWVEEWAVSHPANADQVRRKAPTIEYIDRQIQMQVSCYKVASNKEAIEISGVADAIDSELAGMPAQIAHEIAADVRDSWRSRNSSKADRVGSLIGRVLKKLQALSFVDGRFSDVHKFVSDTWATLPHQGTIEGKDFLVLNGVLSLLCSPTQILNAPLVIAIPDSDQDVKQEVVEDGSAASGEIAEHVKPVKNQLQGASNAPQVVVNAFVW